MKLKNVKNLFTVDFCASKPCKNGGKCDINIDENGFDCFCKGRYRGKTCEMGVTCKFQKYLLVLNSNPNHGAI